jgi:acetylornithine/succinyldiaminopimelate/putrescine aminotransferase
MAKAITGGYAAMGAAITTSEIAKAVEDKINIYSTYGWHPMSVEVAIANIKHITDHQYDLLQNVSEMEELFSSRLGMMRFKMPATIRVKGLAIGIEVGDEEYAKRIQDKCRRHRLLVNRDGTKLSMFPDLNIERDIAEKGLDIFESCIS